MNVVSLKLKIKDVYFVKTKRKNLNEMKIEDQIISPHYSPQLGHLFLKTREI